MTSIIVVLPKMEESIKLKNLLVRGGFKMTCVCGSGSQAISTADQYDDGIVICGYKLVDMMYRELRELLPPGFEFLLIASERALNDYVTDGVMSLTLPLQVHDLLNTVNMLSDSIAVKRRARRQRPAERNARDMELISEAKKLLMTRNNMTEEEAHKYIQRNSMDSGIGLVEMAQMVLTLYNQ